MKGLSQRTAVRAPSNDSPMKNGRAAAGAPVNVTKSKPASHLSPRWYSVFSEIAWRRIEREADLSKFAADKFRSSRARKSDGEIGIATCDVEGANAQHEIDLQIRMSRPQCADGRYDHLIR